jgi:Domain of unknown function (DUF4476)
MKKQITLFLSALFLSLQLSSQNNVNLVIFSEDGDTFYAFVNGIKQNTKPESNVKITGVAPNVSLRIEFENKAYPQLKQNMPLEPGFEHTFRIKKDTKQQMKLRYFGNVPLSEASTGVATVAYHTSDEPESTNQNVENTNVNVGVNTSVNTTTYTTTTTTKTNKNNDDVNVNINVGGMGINMNVNAMGMNGAQVDGMNTTTSTTVTSSSTSYGTPKTNNTTTTNNTNNNTSVTTKAACSVAMSQASFDKMKSSVESKPFSETKMSTAKIATKNACVSVNQVKTICALFSMDEDKLAYAKFAYDYCVNKSEYYLVSEVFSFSTTTDEFNKFLEQ